jgi:hypothetical protein
LKTGVVFPPKRKLCAPELVDFPKETANWEGFSNIHLFLQEYGGFELLKINS